MPESDSHRALPRNLWAAIFHPWTWRMAWRDSRSQRLRLAIFSMAIVAGIAALVSIHSLKSSLETGIKNQAKELLGSDIMISTRQAMKPEDEKALTESARRVSHEAAFSSMLSFPANGSARLVQVRGLDGDFPFYGSVRTTPADAWRRVHEEPGILVDPALLEQFGAKVGDKLKLGSKELAVLGVVNKAAPSSNRFSGFAPEVYTAIGQVEGMGLLGATSLSMRALHLELPPGKSGEEMKKMIRNRWPDANWRLETPDDRQETVGEALERFQQFLGVIGLASLVLGAIGVAGAIHAHIARRVPTVAILRCLGCPGNLAFGIYLAQAMALGLLGALFGAVLGIALQLGVLSYFRASLPIAVEIAPQWAVVAQTTAAGFAVCCGFALLPLLKVRGISPAATLREGAVLAGKSGSWSAWPVYLMLLAALVGLAKLNDPSGTRAFALVAGLGVAFGVLLAVARGLMFLTRRMVRRSWPYLIRQGVSNLHRPRNQTMLFLLSMGLGTFLLVTILLTGNLLREKLKAPDAADSPNIYLIDVQPDQEQGVKDLLAAQHLPVLESAPMVTMRISDVGGVPVNDLAKQDKVPRWVARREFRSTYRDHLNSTETVTSGEWAKTVAGGDIPVPVSLEEKLAADLGVKVGDDLTLDVQGATVKARVSSLRHVDWSRFNLNFFMVFPPGVLEEAPGFNVVTTKVPDGPSSGLLQRELVKSYPNVSVINLIQILETVRGIFAQISLIVRVLAGFTILAGIPILIGTLLNGRDMRLRESVLLRTLGASARQVRTILVVEFMALGVISALTGLVLAVAANAALAKSVFKGNPWPDFSLLCWAFVITSGFSIVGGLILSRGVSRHPPLEILRGGA